MRISDWSSDVCSSDLAARVVDRAVADVVAIDRRAAAEVIPMAGVEDIFVWTLGARQHADHVARHLLRNLVIEAEVRLHAGQGDGLEPLLLRGFAQRVEILPRAREQLLRLRKLDPAEIG